jgi:hypothetical protein
LAGERKNCAGNGMKMCMNGREIGSADENIIKLAQNCMEYLMLVLMAFNLRVLCPEIERQKFYQLFDCFLS